MAATDYKNKSIVFETSDFIISLHDDQASVVDDLRNPSEELYVNIIKKKPWEVVAWASSTYELSRNASRTTYDAKMEHIAKVINDKLDGKQPSEDDVLNMIPSVGLRHYGQHLFKQLDSIDAIDARSDNDQAQSLVESRIEEITLAIPALSMINNKNRFKSDFEEEFVAAKDIFDDIAYSLTEEIDNLRRNGSDSIFENEDTLSTSILSLRHQINERYDTIKASGAPFNKPPIDANKLLPFALVSPKSTRDKIYSLVKAIGTEPNIVESSNITLELQTQKANIGANKYVQENILLLASMCLKGDENLENFEKNFMDILNSSNGDIHPFIRNTKGMDKAVSANPNAIKFLSHIAVLSEKEQKYALQAHVQYNMSLPQTKMMKDGLVTPNGLTELINQNIGSGTSFRNILKSCYAMDDNLSSVRMGKKMTNIIAENLKSANKLDLAFSDRDPLTTFYTEQGAKLHILNATLPSIIFEDSKGEAKFSGSHKIPDVGFLVDVLPYLDENQFSSHNEFDDIIMSYENLTLRALHRENLCKHLNDVKDSQGRKFPLSKVMQWVPDTISASRSPDSATQLSHYHTDHMIEDSEDIGEKLITSLALGIMSKSNSVEGSTDMDAVTSAQTVKEKLKLIEVAATPLSTQSMYPLLSAIKPDQSATSYKQRYVTWSQDIHNISARLNKVHAPQSRIAWEPSTPKVPLGQIDGKQVYANPLHRFGDVVSEGEAMNHCVGTYAADCMTGNYYAWSITEEAPDGHSNRLSTLGMLPTGDGSVEFDQHFGYNNDLPSAELDAMVQRFSDQLENPALSGAHEQKVIFTPTAYDGDIHPRDTPVLVMSNDFRKDDFIADAYEGLSRKIGQENLKKALMDFAHTIPRVFASTSSPQMMQESFIREVNAVDELTRGQTLQA